MCIRDRCKDDLLYYTKNSDVLDRAGSYGIQDYIGHIGVKKIDGSYSNVLGFPTNLFVKTINSMNLWNGLIHTIWFYYLI